MLDVFNCKFIQNDIKEMVYSCPYTSIALNLISVQFGSNCG